MTSTTIATQTETGQSVNEEAQRLAVLAEYGVMDTPPERDFDVLVQRVAQVCDAPIALLGLIGADRHWFKARVGVEIHEVPRAVTFCAHTVLGDDIFEVPDAAVDPRFAGDALVTGEPGIRFYAGVPLRSREGPNLGTVCVIDRVPRRLSAAQRDALRQVGRDAAAQLERRRQLRGPLFERMLETVDRDPLEAEPGELPVAGARLGRYTILDELGRGAMATVYAAYDEQLDRKVAIKLIRNPNVRVQQEARAVARISHPNVVPIYEIGTFEGHDFIAMELIVGGRLSTWQWARSRNIHDIIAMYAQAGRGLAAAHRAGLVHRDFKPDNVIVDSSGRPRVGDFGLAHVRGPAGDHEQDHTPASADDLATRDDSVVGTPAYMAPEQLLCGDVDERTDQFGLCAALYEAVYGVRPYRGGSLEELRASARAGVLQEPPAGATVPPALGALLRRGLAPNPADRWPSLADLLDQLDLLDAQRDPAAAGSQRRRIVIALVVCTAAFGVQINSGATDAADIHLGPMLATPVGVLLVMGLGVYLARAALPRNSHHRRMITVLFAIILGDIIVPLVGARAGFSVEQIVLVEMLLTGHAFLTAAPIVSPRFLLGWAISWVGAASLTFGAPVLPTSTLCSLLCTVVFVLSWSYVPSGTPHLLGRQRVPLDEALAPQGQDRSSRATTGCVASDG